MTDKPPTDDRWLDVLAGRAEPDDHATAQAARARAFHAQLAAADQATPVDEQRLKRLSNLMQAQAEQQWRPQAAPAAQPAGLMARLAGWLGAPGGAQGLRYGGVAVVVMGLAVLVVNRTGNGDEDDATTMKSPPAVIVSPDTAPSAAPGPVLVVTGAEPPLSRALALHAALQQVGVSAEVFPLGDKARLDATVAPAQQAEVSQLLAAQGITWAGGALLSIEFRHAP